MEDFKKELFKNEYGFDLEYKTLSFKESKIIKSKFIDKYNISSKNEVIFAQELRQKQHFLFNIKDRNNFLLNELEILNIKFQNNIYINWYDFKDIDILNINNIDKYFDDIWFLESDAIDLFDINLNWILSIDYNGDVYYC